MFPASGSWSGFAASVELSARNPSLPAGAILDKLLAHGRSVRAERAWAAGESPNFQPVLREWDGVGCAVRPAVGDDTASPHTEGTTLKTGKRRREVP